MNPLVSVIIPVHNGERFIREALASVAAQDYAPMEVIVSDDGSQDGTRDACAGFPGVRVLALERGGVSRARNRAIAVSSGEWLAFLDADDEWMPGKLSAQITLAAESKTSLVLCHEVNWFEGPVPAWFRGPTDGTPVIAYEPSAWLVQRDAFEHIGRFDEQRSLGEDTHWLSRAWDKGYKHAVCPETFLRRRIHAANATGNIANQRGIVFDILRESIQRKRERSGEAHGA